MPHKDAERRKKTDKEYRIKNAERLKEYGRERRKQKGMIPHDSHYDFETHRELAISSGISEAREWYECAKRGFLPDGIYHNPAQRVFRRK